MAPPLSRPAPCLQDACNPLIERVFMLAPQRRFVALRVDDGIGIELAMVAVNGGERGVAPTRRGATRMNSAVPETDWVPARRGFWLRLLLCAALAAVGAVSMELATLAAPPVFEDLLSYRLTTGANTLLVAACALYLVSRFARSPTIGCWGSWLAVVGAGGVLAGLLARWLEIAWLLPASVGAVPHLYDLVVAASFVTVAGYLATEAHYRDRSAGAVVFPAVLVAVGLEIWLVANGASAPDGAAWSLSLHWEAARDLAQTLGIAAFGGAAAAGLVYLGRYAAHSLCAGEGQFSAWCPDHWKLYEIIYSAVVAGLPVLAVALALGFAWRVLDAAPMQGGAQDAWLLGACVLYGVFAWRARRGLVSGPALAAGAVVSFAGTVGGLVWLEGGLGLAGWA